MHILLLITTEIHLHRAGMNENCCIRTISEPIVDDYVSQPLSWEFLIEQWGEGETNDLAIPLKISIW